MARVFIKLAVLTVLLITTVFVPANEVWALEGVEQTMASGSAQVAQNNSDDVNDPLESLNRLIFRFNQFLQTVLLRPVATLYNENLPAVFRSGVRNFLSNLSTPVTIANQLLQGDPKAAIRSIGRFVVNSTIGIGGINDVDSTLDGSDRSEDFGQTLGRWGAGEGFYLVLPIFGPSNPRDAIGKFLVDPYFDPVGFWISNTDQTKLYWSRKVVDGISEYAKVVDELDQMRKTSVDYYAVIRSLYRQKRKSEISNGDLIDIPPIPDLGYKRGPNDFGQPLAKVVK